MHFHPAIYEFEAGMSVLRKSFKAAMGALAGEVAAARQEAVAYKRRINEGGDWIGERDDDGRVIWDQSDILAWQIEKAEAAEMAVRKAFVIPAYHLWERSTIPRARGAKPVHKDFVAAMKMAGVEVHAKLDAVNNLVNVLKHGSSTSGGRLSASWPAVLDVDDPPRPWDWYEAVRLRDADVEEAFSILEASAMRHDTSPVSQP